MITAPAETEDPEVALGSIKADLSRRFARSGCVARSTDFAQLFPRTPADSVVEALHRLCEEQVVEIEWLADGGLVFQFPRR